MLVWLTCCRVARAQAREDQSVPAAWVSPGTKPAAIVELRSFYDYVTGVGGPRPDWKGGELLGYFDLGDGMSGAFIARHEMRDQVGDYVTAMLIPRISKDKYLVSSIGIGTGADFLPVTRLDLQLRAFFERPGWKHVMYDLGGYATWWTSSRRQVAQSNALIFWYNPLIVEARETLTLTDPGSGGWRLNGRGTLVVLYGMDRVRWLMLRLTAGTEPENVPGMAFAETKDRPIATAALGYQRWITPAYGVSAEIEGYHQLATWSRLSVITSLFASF